jgi:FtsZ-interacting cell division protein YlmF
MTFIAITTIARTSSRWINPPRVYEETRPSAQRISNMIAIVTNMEVLLLCHDLAAEPLNPV